LIRGQAFFCSISCLFRNEVDFVCYQGFAVKGV
jgi:hypothetical protein